MVIFYDAVKAKSEVELFKKKERNRLTVGAILTAIGITGVLLAGLVLLDFLMVEWLGAVGAALALIAIVVLNMLTHDEYLMIKPSVAARYYMTVEGKKVLGVRVEKRPGAWTPYESVRLLTETSTGVVENIELCVAKYQENTTVSEAVFDVNAGIIYTPYRHEESES